MNYGDFPIEETIHVFFTTRAFATGIPGTLSAATVAVYEDITATPIETGIGVTESLNSVAGLNAVPIVAIAASGYEVGKNYHVVITAGTVDSVSVVGEVVAYFSIGRSAAAVDLANGTDGLGVIKAETALIVADTGETQGKLPSNKFMGSSDGADDDGNINAILADTGTDGVVLATNAITEAKIADNAFATEHFATGAITADTLGADTITAAKIADNSIAVEHIANGAITAAKITAMDSTAWTNSQNFFDTTGWVGGTIKLTTDMTKISGDAPAADNLEEATTAIVSDTAKAGTLSVTEMSTNLTEATNDHYIGRTVIWTDGDLAGQASAITDYVGTNGVLTYDTVTDAPTAGDAFVIV